MTEEQPSVVCDAGPLIHLSELESLWLLGDFSSVLVPQQVWEEVERHRPAALQASDVSLQKVEVPLSSEGSFQALVQTLALDLGEQAALALAQRHPEAIFLTDDAAARVAAQTLQLSVHGTIGILVRAIRRRQLQRHEVVTLLEQLPERSTLFISVGLLQEIIARIQRDAP